MTEHLKNKIENAARDLKSKNAAILHARNAQDENDKLILDLARKLQDANSATADLRLAKEQAIADAQVAAQRYAFYCNEAVTHPYDFS